MQEDILKPEGGISTAKKEMFLIAGIIVILLVAAVLFAVNGLRHGAATNPVATNPVTPAIPGAATDSATNPPAAPFPAGLPIESNAASVSAYHTAGKDGMTQFTYQYVSFAALGDTMLAYQKYFTNAGWTVKVGVDVPSAKVLSATKGNETALVTLSANPGGASARVNIDLVVPSGT